MVDLVLVSPSNKIKIYGELNNSLAAIEPPFWATLIAAFVRKNGFSVVIIDAAAENLSPGNSGKQSRSVQSAFNRYYCFWYKPFGIHDEHVRSRKYFESHKEDAS